MELHEELKKQKRKYLIIAIVLGLVNLLVYNFFNRTGGFTLSGEYIEYSVIQALKSSIITLFISTPVVCFILGLIIAMLPYKGLVYSQKYLRAVLIVMIIAYSFLLFAGIAGSSVFKKNEGMKSNNKQNEKLEKYKKELISIRDSSVLYFDKAIEDVNKNNDVKLVSKKYGPKIGFFQYKLDSLSNDFYIKLNEYGLTQSQYDSCMNSIKNEFNILINKFNEYKNKGLTIEN